MQFNEFRTFDFDAEDTAGVATVETEEDVETYLDRFADDDSAELEGETPTSEPGPSQPEPTPEKEPVSPDSDVTPTPEPSAAEPTSDEGKVSEPAKTLFADKYNSIEDLEAAYRQQATETRRITEENNQLKGAQQTAPTETVPEKPEPVEADAGTQKFFDAEKFNTQHFDKSPAEAFELGMEQYQASLNEKQSAEFIRTAETEAADFNKTIGQERARELVVEAATKAELPEADISKLSNKDNLITEEILKQFPAAAEQLYAEIDYIDAEFARQPILRNGEKISDNGKYRKDAFKNANIILNHDKIVSDTHLAASESTVKAIQKAEPGVKVMTPTEESHAEVEVAWTGNESPNEAADKAGQMSDEARETALDEWGG